MSNLGKSRQPTLVGGSRSSCGLGLGEAVVQQLWTWSGTEAGSAVAPLAPTQFGRDPLQGWLCFPLCGGCVFYLSNIRKGPRKKMFSIRHCPKERGGGPCPHFFAIFRQLYFWSRKKNPVLQKRQCIEL